MVGEKNMDCCKKETEDKSNKSGTMKHHKSENSHFWMMFGCVAMIIVVFAATYLLKLSGNYITWILLALCAGMHLFMMKGHNH